MTSSGVASGVSKVSDAARDGWCRGGMKGGRCKERREEEKKTEGPKNRILSQNILKEVQINTKLGGLHRSPYENIEA